LSHLIGYAQPSLVNQINYSKAQINDIAIKELILYEKLSKLKWIAAIMCICCEFKKGVERAIRLAHMRAATHTAGLSGLDMIVCVVRHQRRFVSPNTKHEERVRDDEGK